MRTVRILLAAVSVSALLAVPALAQTAREDRLDTAKPSDTVSPYGVSYTTGTFSYSVPLFTIGNGEWPDKITVNLEYDSSGARLPNSAWSLSPSRRSSGQFVSYVTGFEDEPLEDRHTYGLNIVSQNTSVQYYVGGAPLSPPFQSGGTDGHHLDYSNNKFLFTDHVGNELSFGAGVAPNSESGLITSSTSSLRLADGELIKFRPYFFINHTMSLPETSKGLLVRVEPHQDISSSIRDVRVCAYNLARTDIADTDNCDRSNVVATIRYERFPDSYLSEVTQVTRPDNSIYRFEYEQYFGGSQRFDNKIFPGRTRYHLSCVKEPGQSSCAIRNTYDPCDGYGYAGGNPDIPDDVGWSGSRDRVVRQDLGDGRRINYSYSTSTPNRACRGVGQVTIDESGASTIVMARKDPGSKATGRRVISYEDSLQREVIYEWTGSTGGRFASNNLLAAITQPNGQRVEYTYDGRGNRIETRLKSNRSESDIVTTATFPSVCSNRKTCNKPMAVTDAEGHTTTFTYSPTHGGVLSMVGPAVNGVSPATKYYYVQREAWLKDGGGYAKTGVPIWMLSEERSCRTSSLNLSTGTCSGGSGDLLRTRYDYGPDSGPNNLWLRGVAVTANGETLRTCYSYDELGRRISETQPKAGLASCP